MLSRRIHTSALLLVGVLALGSTLWAQSTEVAPTDILVPTAHTLTMTFKGSIGPVLSGSDPLGLNGQSGTVTIQASESLSPVKQTATSATYKLPAGAITVVAGSNKFKTASSSTMIIKLTSTADILTLVASVQDIFTVKVMDTTFLKAGSWTTAVLKHPTKFKPSPQKLTSAKTAGGPGCKIKYTVEGSTTVLGFSGTGSSSQTVDPMLTDDWDQ
jgi:hypothetical protein